MNALDRKIQELFCQVAHLRNWGDAETFQKYVGIRNLVERGHNSRAVMISILKIALEA
jgi:hypothetical protein